MTVSGELCCVALPFCGVVIVALPFSAEEEDEEDGEIGVLAVLGTSI